MRIGSCRRNELVVKERFCLSTDRKLAYTFTKSASASDSKGERLKVNLCLRRLESFISGVISVCANWRIVKSAFVLLLYDVLR